MAHRKNIMSLLAPIDPDIAENVRLEPVPGGFVNLTGYTVGDQVAALLSYGPRFLQPEDASIPEVLSAFGEIHVQIERHTGNPNTGSIFLEMLDKYKEAKDNLFKIRQPSLMEATIRQAVIEAKNFFRQQPQACIVQSDKGNKTCLMTLNDYQAKMDQYVEKCKTKGVYQLTTQRRVDATAKIFQELRHAILAIPLSSDQKELQQLFNGLRRFHNAKLPYLYGNVKCHKPDAPVRPICSTVAWYSRPIQRLLLFLMKTHFGPVLCKQNVARINDAATEVAEIIPHPDYVFTKLDVTDMYGSMDKHRIAMLLDRLFQTIEDEGKSILPKSIVSRMIRFSLEQSCLVGYNNEIYVQVMGLPQGACDSGFLATVYLDYVLQLHYEELFTAHRVRYWAKYMDDFLLYLPSQNIKFFKQKIEYLTGLAFEIEPEEEQTEGVYYNQGVVRTIPFLDINIHTTKEGKHLISNYRKPTASLRMIHALSNTINLYKVNTMQSFLMQIFKRTSTEFLTHDMDTLYHRMLMNGYSHNFIECIFYKAITQETQKLQLEIRAVQGNIMETKQKRITLAKNKNIRAQILTEYQTQFSLDTTHHYENIREQYVATSTQPGYKFPYRSVSMSRLVFTACQYANMPPPLYCRAENTDVFRKFLGHKRIKATMQTIENAPLVGERRMALTVGMLHCITCGMIFVVSGRDKLQIIVEQEFQRPNSEISEHQTRLQHTVSPAIQPLRPVTGVDTAYLCQLYLAVYRTMGLSTSDRFVLSSLPSFVRTMLHILRGATFPQNTTFSAEEHSPATWLTRAIPYLPHFGDHAPRTWPSEEDDATTTPACVENLEEPSVNEAENTRQSNSREAINHAVPAKILQPENAARGNKATHTGYNDQFKNTISANTSYTVEYNQVVGTQPLSQRTPPALTPKVDESKQTNFSAGEQPSQLSLDAADSQTTKCSHLFDTATLPATTTPPHAVGDQPTLIQATVTNSAPEYNQYNQCTEMTPPPFRHTWTCEELNDSQPPRPLRTSTPLQQSSTEDATYDNIIPHEWTEDSIFNTSIINIPSNVLLESKFVSIR